MAREISQIDELRAKFTTSNNIDVQIKWKNQALLWHRNRLTSLCQAVLSRIEIEETSKSKLGAEIEKYPELRQFIDKYLQTKVV